MKKNNWFNKKIEEIEKEKAQQSIILLIVVYASRCWVVVI